MSKIVKSKDSNGVVNTLVLEEGDLAVLQALKSKSSGSVKVTISGAAVKGDIVFVAHKGRHYEFQKKDLFR